MPPVPRRSTVRLRSIATATWMLVVAATAGACAANPASRARPAAPGERAPPAGPPPATALATPPHVVPPREAADARSPAPTEPTKMTSPPPVADPPRPPAAPPSPPAPPAHPPMTWPDLVASLRTDPAFAAHRDLLAVAERAAPSATTALVMERVPDLEAAVRATVGRGTGWAVVTTYVEPDADATALRAAYLDFDRLGEWTGKPSTKVLETRGDVKVVRTDGIRAAFGVRYGARWRFEARAVDRGTARAVVTRQVDDPDTVAMVATRGLLLLVPETGGVRVVECSASLVDYEVPALLRALAAGAALAEMKARVTGVRGHWREYVGR